MSERRCGDSGGVTKEGLPCRARLNLSPVTGRCIQHDPERVEAARQLWSEGGQASGAVKRKAKAALPEGVPRAPRTLNDAVEVASWITRAVLIGEIDVRVAEAATKAVRQFQLGEEKHALEQRIKQLQAQLKEFQQRRGSHG